MAGSPVANITIKNATSYIDESSMMEEIVPIVVVILFGIIIVLGLFGNALVVIVVAANKQMRSTTNILIINLAVADLLFIVFCVPFTAADYILPFWPFGDLWCKTVQYLIIVTAYASVYTLVLMSLDRFLAVVHPIASMSVRTETNALIAIVVIWVVIIVATTPVYVCHGLVAFDYGNKSSTVCVFLEEGLINSTDLQGASYNKPAFQISFFAFSYVIPLALICGLYMWMLLKLWRGVAPGGRCSAESRRGKKRVTRMVLVVVAIFAICWCPIQVILVLKSINAYSTTTTVSVLVQIVSHVLAYMNSCVNPILYAFLSENFRKAFRKVIYCGPESRRSQLTLNNHHGGTKTSVARTTTGPRTATTTITTTTTAFQNNDII